MGLFGKQAVVFGMQLITVFRTVVHSQQKNEIGFPLADGKTSLLC